MEESCRGTASQRWIRTYSGWCRADFNQVYSICFVVLGFFFLGFFKTVLCYQMCNWQLYSQLLLEIAGMVIVVDIIHKTVGLGVSQGLPLCKGLYRCRIKR